MLRKKWFTWGLIIAIIVLPMPALFKYLQTYVVRNAVVTAYLFEVRAPIDGIVDVLKTEAGTIPEDAPVVILRNTRLPHAGINTLKARYQANKTKLALFQNELSVLEHRLASYQNKLVHHRFQLQTDLERSADILKARQAGENARLYEASQNRIRSQNMRDPYKLTQMEADRVEADFREAAARLQATGLALKQTEHRRQMVSDNLILSDLSDSVLQIQGHIHSLFFEIMDCKRRIQASENDLATGEASLQAAITDHERLSTAAIRLPDTAVIWDVAVSEDMELSRGDRILSYIDRSRLMVDVVIDDATLEWIYEGQPVRIRLFGSTQFINGSVIRVTGSASARKEERLAAHVRGKSIRDGRILVLIDAPQLVEDISRFCGVGRTAYAEFEGIGLIRQYFGSFFR